jgi:hypothetical protein
MTGQSAARAGQLVRRRSIAVQGLAVCLLCSEAVFVGLLGTSLLAPDGTQSLVLLGLVWLFAAALYVANITLVRTGPQAQRIVHAPMLVNRPAFVVRLTFHLIINWSAIAVTLLWAGTVADPRLAAGTARICIVAIGLLWISFNVMHRRFNRARNLILSSVPAASLLLAALLMIRLAEAAAAR